MAYLFFSHQKDGYASSEGHAAPPEQAESDATGGPGIFCWWFKQQPK